MSSTGLFAAPSRGRRRQDGERYPSGKLRPATAVPPVNIAPAPSLAAGPLLSAAERYEREYERTLRIGSGGARVAANEALRLARSVLNPRQIAAMDMIAGRGVSTAQLAARTGRPQAELEDVFRDACVLLAEHYGAADGR